MEEIIPLLVISLSFTIPILAIIVDGVNKRSRDRTIEKAIERGLSERELRRLMSPEERKRRPRRPFKAGLILMAVGATFLIVRAAAMNDVNGWNELDNDGRFGFLFAGTIVLMIGIALFLADLLGGPARRREEEAERREMEAELRAQERPSERLDP